MDINMVSEILRDRQGFMWFGTTDGLVRYDGYHFKHYPYDPETRYPMKNKGINGLMESSSGNIWMISGRMLLLHNPRLDTFYTVNNLGRDSLIRFGSRKYNEAFLQDSSGNLWLRSQKGLFKVRENQGTSPFEVQQYQHEPGNAFSLSSDTVHALLYDSRHRLWAGTHNGLSFYDRENEKMVPLNGCHAPVTSLRETTTGKICIGTINNGLYVYDPDTGNFENFLPKAKNDVSIAGKWVKQVVRDGKGNIWLLAGSSRTNRMSLQRFDPEKGEFRSYFEPYEPPGYNPAAAFLLFVDRTGLLWVTTGMGLKRFDPYREVFTNILQRETYLEDWSLPYTFYEDRNGILWISVLSKGLLKYAPSTDKFRYRPPADVKGENMAGDLVRAIYEDSRGYLWQRVTGGTDRFAFDENGELQKTAHYPFEAIYFWEDRHNRLWIGTWGGLKGFDVRTGQFFPLSTLPNLKGLNFITKEDKEGWLWSVSRGNGAKRYNPSTGEIVHLRKLRANPGILEDGEGNFWFNGSDGLKKYDLQTGKLTYSLKGFEINYSVWGEDGIMWMTTSGRGLYRFNTRTGESKCYLPKNGFPTLRPIGIFKDAHGKLWMSSDVGVICFDPETETSRLFDESDGLPSTVFSYGSCQRSNGEFFFPLWEGGFVRFHPDSLWSDSIAPKPAIVDFRLFNQPVEIGGENSPLTQAIWATEHLILNHNQNNFTLGFTAFHYAAPAHNQFLYKMEGSRADWNDPGGQRSVNFAGLSPGNYIFHLKAANHDNVWSEPRALKITILPPWWATWWAYLLYLLLLSAAAFAFYFYKKRQWKLQSQLELEHREAERLKELDAVKTRLYTNITHEFRTPLTVILGMAKQVRANPGEWFSEGLKMIERNGRNLLRLVNQMLDLSKLEAGALPLNKVQSDVVAFLKYLLESFHSLVEGKNIRLDFLSETEMLMMDFDPEKLRKIVSNLLSNAIKFTPEGGEVEVKLAVGSGALTTFEKLSTLTLTVKDTGPGIPLEKLPHIFDRFFQVGMASANSAESSTGIGLALTKELVKLLGGEIAVESEMGKGSKFIVTLPVRREAPLQTDATDLEVTPAIPQIHNSPIPRLADDRPILLLVEDNGDVLTYLRSILSGNYSLEESRNGREGIEKAIEMVPDLIVSDVMMPEADGFELCQTLKTDERTSHIPIILLTAKADATSRLEGLECGADAYLAKPFEKDELLVRTRKLLELRQRLWEQFTTKGWFTPLPGKTFFVQDDFLEKLKTVLDENFSDENFDIPQLCEALLMSRAQLYRKVKALTGKPVGHLLRSFRMQKAKALLETTSLSVSQVALEVGFKYLGHFSRSFQQEFGANPSEMRK
jgi:signal transduction histidine kinase/ligand-binding sensor domain-containing protein/CheY-like chemotaxis protein